MKPKPQCCNCCGHPGKLVEVTIRRKKIRLCDPCAVAVVSDLQRALVPAMR